MGHMLSMHVDSKQPNERNRLIENTEDLVAAASKTAWTNSFQTVS